MTIEAVVLAAGYSSRMHTNKMLLPLGNKYLIEHTVENLHESCKRIVVVLGHCAQEIKKVLNKYDYVEFVENTRYDLGMFTSVKKGVSLIGSNNFLLTPGDYPVVKHTSINMLAWSTAEILIPTCDGRKGHPVFFNSTVIKKIVSEGDESNLRNVILKVGFDTVETYDGGILMDVDTVEDYERIKTYYAEYK